MSDNSNSQIRLIDDMNSAQLQFASPQIEVQDEVSTANIDGLCNSSHNGAHLRWSIWSGTDASQPLATGDGSCAGGQFNLAMTGLDQLVCGVDHVIQVEGDWGGSAEAQLVRHCQPLASQPVAAPTDSPMGTSCFLEYSPATEAEQPCLQVCYRDSLLVYEQPADVSQCSGLAAGLAGP